MSFLSAQESLIGDLLSMDIGAPPAPAAPAALDLLAGGLDVLVRTARTHSPYINIH